ncbi:MAG: cytochrome c biogenesis protein CcsA [Flavobacteriales bacterium]|nr:cytochrome c biogenesis protein CcsA [Flavobacteriales bacterium]
MARNWWKFLGLALVLYASITTLLTPLDPGILTTDRSQLEPGVQEFTVLAFNTHFESEKDNLLIFLKSEEITLCGEVVEVSDDVHARVRFDIPERMPLVLADLYVNNPSDGTLYLPNAVSLNNMNAEASLPESCAQRPTSEEVEAFGFPFLPTIFETIKNLIFHVPMWFTMFFLMGISFVQSLLFLNKSAMKNDIRAEQSVMVGLVFCILGLTTGSVWARFTWGAWWVNDPQLNGAMATFLIYAAYLVLRRSVNEESKRARVAAVYNIFAFVMLVVLLMILPKFTESLHPGKGGTPAFSSYDLDSALRTVFYPAVLGWILIGYWIYTMRLRLTNLTRKVLYNE